MTPEELGREIDKLAESERVYMPGREAQVMRWAALRVAGVEIQRLQGELAARDELIEQLRLMHHTPYVDDEHQGGNCVDAIMALNAKLGRGVLHTPQPAAKDKPCVTCGLYPDGSLLSDHDEINAFNEADRLIDENGELLSQWESDLLREQRDIPQAAGPTAPSPGDQTGEDQ